MIKSDLPPSYEESHHHQQEYSRAQPQEGNNFITRYTFPTPVSHKTGVPTSGIPAVIPTHMSLGTPPTNPDNTMVMYLGILLYISVFLHSAVFSAMYLFLMCCEKARRRYPLNWFLLFIFTLAMAYMAGTTSSYYEMKAVFLAVGITALACIAVTVFSFQTKVKTVHMLSKHAFVQPYQINPLSRLTMANCLS
ncbi:protein lifeguard 3, partial [Tachysurus ichikawai]